MDDSHHRVDHTHTHVRTHMCGVNVDDVVSTRMDPPTELVLMEVGESNMCIVYRDSTVIQWQ